MRSRPVGDARTACPVLFDHLAGSTRSGLAGLYPARSTSRTDLALHERVRVPCLVDIRCVGPEHLESETFVESQGSVIVFLNVGPHGLDSSRPGLLEGPPQYEPVQATSLELFQNMDSLDLRNVGHGVLVLRLADIDLRVFGDSAVDLRRAGG